MHNKKGYKHIYRFKRVFSLFFIYPNKYSSQSVLLVRITSRCV
nr:MAG TPA: hypothetical protein [Caudoviricetes sp.]